MADRATLTRTDIHPIATLTPLVGSHHSSDACAHTATPFRHAPRPTAFHEMLAHASQHPHMLRADST